MANLAVAFLVLVLIMPQTSALSGNVRLSSNPKSLLEINKWIKVFKGVAKVVNLTMSSQEIKPPRIGARRSQAAATKVIRYTYGFDVGTPTQHVSRLQLDINSELVWMKCADSSTRQQGGDTLFDPKESSTLAKEQCESSKCQRFSPQTCSSEEDEECLLEGSHTTGYLATEKFRFGNGDHVNMTFGCGISFDADDSFAGVSGVVGLGRGPLSLVSQRGVGRFSYYVAPDGDSSKSKGVILFGDDAKPQTSSALSTPLLESDAYPNSYLVGLTGIQVDGQDLPIPTGTFDSGGVVLSTAIPLTFLDERAYKLLRKELQTKIGLETVDGSALGLDLCYTNASLTKANVPAVALVFDGNIAVIMELETRNYFYMDADTGLECLTILPSPSKLSVLGSLIQVGTHMIYDVPGKKLQFESFQKKALQRWELSKGSPRIFSSPLVAKFVFVVLVCVLY